VLKKIKIKQTLLQVDCHIGSAILNFEFLIANSYLAIPKIHRYQTILKKVKITTKIVAGCLPYWIRHVGSAILNF
jgi:hypothetical protein